MLKFIKHNLEEIDGVAIYPLISLLIFMTVFILMLYYVFRLPKSTVEDLSSMPLNEDILKESENER